MPELPNSCGGYLIRNFAKASLIDLVAIYLGQTHPGLLPKDLGGVDTLRQAHIPAEFKRSLLQTVGRECGQEALLSIGQGISHVTYDPIWHNALRSENPAVLFGKWRRFEVFSHSKNRLEIDFADGNKARFKRYSTGDGIPTAAENLFICGLIIGLLEGIGCRGLSCEMAAQGGRVLRIRDKRCFWLPDDPASLVTGEWTIGWRAHADPEGMGTTDEALLLLDLPPIGDQSLAALVKKVTDLLMRDVARQWKTGDLASALGLSSRTLQRRLGETGLSFSHLVRLVRISKACRLLQSGDTPLTVIGFCAGFSDSAHFSRDFRASVGLTPSEFRAIQ
ncbi:MAG: AraC family transcriptional regulator [Ascidiaceihabitans sp.]|uniref:helix-turn-helix transcriptional regulator n=1 Tax=Ascidiaceihabitans sp. TaxID=1872644 RepID=UPI003298F0EA